MIIYYLPFRKNPNRISGSTLRPEMIKEAFKKNGTPCLVIEGTLKNRILLIVRNLLKIVFIYTPGSVYIEPTTAPFSMIRVCGQTILNIVDVPFLLFLRLLGWKIGYFVRDIYWSETLLRSSGIQTISNTHKLFYFIDLLFLWSVSIIYIPSNGCKEYFPFFLKRKRFEALPSGCSPIMQMANGDSLIYTGGILPPYDLSLFLDVVNKYKYRTVIVAREKEHYKIHKSIDYDVIQLISASGKELNSIYEHAKIGVLLIKPTVYMKIAMGYKLFDYLSHGIPVVAYKGTSMGDFIDKHRVGWTLEYDENELASFFKWIMNDDSNYIDIINNVLRVRDDHSWDARVKYILKSLS